MVFNNLAEINDFATLKRFKMHHSRHGKASVHILFCFKPKNALICELLQPYTVVFRKKNEEYSQNQSKVFDFFS